MKTSLIKTSLSLFLCAVLILLSFSACSEKTAETAPTEAPITAEGEIEGGIKWKLQSGTLTITGEGDMPVTTMSVPDPPQSYRYQWKEYKNIKSNILLNHYI